MPDFDTSPTRPGPVMFAGMIPALDFPGEMMPGQFGPMIRVLLPVVDGVRPGHGGVVHRHPLGDHHGQPDPGVDRLDDRVLGERRRHEQHRHVGAGLVHRLGHRAEHRQLGAVEIDGGAGLAGVHPADDVRAGRQHPPGVLAALGAGHALHDDPGVLVQKDRHRSDSTRIR